MRLLPFDELCGERGSDLHVPFSRGVSDFVLPDGIVLPCFAKCMYPRPPSRELSQGRVPRGVREKSLGCKVSQSFGIRDSQYQLVVLLECGRRNSVLPNASGKTLLSVMPEMLSTKTTYGSGCHVGHPNHTLLRLISAFEPVLLPNLKVTACHLAGKLRVKPAVRPFREI